MHVKNNAHHCKILHPTSITIQMCSTAYNINLENNSMNQSKQQLHQEHTKETCMKNFSNGHFRKPFQKTWDKDLSESVWHTKQWKYGKYQINVD